MYASSNRPYKLAHQVLSINNINFHQKSYIGVTELHILPQKHDLKTIKLNCKQCKIFQIMVNDFYECQFSYSDPCLSLFQNDFKLRNLDLLTAKHNEAISCTDPEKNLGEIIIQIPTQLYNYVAEGKILVFNIEFGLEKPQGGIHFVCPNGNDDISGDKMMHMFTCSNENSSRMWFPSIDTFNEACTWKLEFTVDSEMTAVSCGELIETVFSYDLKKKTFHYVVNTPVVPPAIGLAIGYFEIMVDPFMHEVTHFCLPHLLPLLKDTCSFLHEAFEFYEELLSTRYPYTCYKQVFVDEAYHDVQPYATLAICDTYLLHSKHIIDQTYITRRILGQAIAEQFFGCFITMNSTNDAWLTRGISSYLGSQFYRKAFGNNEYKHYIDLKYKEVIEYEHKYGGVILDNSKSNETNTATTNNNQNFHFFINHIATYSPLYNQVHKTKSMLFIRILEDRIGRELMLQVFNKLLALAVTASQQKINQSLLNAWNNMLVSTSSFSKAIFTVTGKDIESYLNQWVYVGGHPKFQGNFIFNRKRNTVELEIKQLETSALGIRKYMGPLSVWVQELDGTFKHNLQIEENITKHDITCHSKSRRNKKKKIPLCTGEEVDMDLSIMDSESPVLWIRIDPEMQLIREVVFEQPDFQWQYQLRYERDVVAQLEAIEQLKKYASPYTRKALTDTIENTQAFFRVRCQAAQCLTAVVNQMANTWTGPPAMMAIFKKLFGSFSCQSIIKLNNFSNFQIYFLQKSMPLAMARLRTLHGSCPIEVLHFLLDLFKYNDNSKNKFSDNYYRAALVEAIVETLTPVVSAVLSKSGIHHISSDGVSSETKLILDEIIRFFNMEKLLPCYHFTVTVSCLKAFRYLQKMGHLPNNPKFFREYTQYGIYKEIRVAAVEALVDIIKVEQRKNDLMFLFYLLETDPVPNFKYQVLRLLTENPPITRKDTNNALNTEEVVDRIWRLINSYLAFDPRLRCACVDMYYAFFGRSRPACIPKPEFSLVVNLKQQKALVNSKLDDEDEYKSEDQSFNQNDNYEENLFDNQKRELNSPKKRTLKEAELDEFDEKFNKEKRLKLLEDIQCDKMADRFLSSSEEFSNLNKILNNSKDINQSLNSEYYLSSSKTDVCQESYQLTLIQEKSFDQYKNSFSVLNENSSNPNNLNSPNFTSLSMMNTEVRDLEINYESKVYSFSGSSLLGNKESTISFSSNKQFMIEDESIHKEKKNKDRDKVTEKDNNVDNTEGNNNKAIDNNIIINDNEIKINNDDNEKNEEEEKDYFKDKEKLDIEKDEYFSSKEHKKKKKKKHKHKHKHKKDKEKDKEKNKDRDREKDLDIDNDNEEINSKKLNFSNSLLERSKSSSLIKTVSDSHLSEAENSN